MGEPDCRTIDECGEQIACRPAAQCLAVPTCQGQERGSDRPCGPGENNCLARFMCGGVIYCRDAPVDGALPLDGCGQAELPVDAFSIDEARVDGDRLMVRVSSSGGCEDHEFVGCQRPIVPMEPIQFRITLAHDANNDACEAVISEELVFDLTIIRDIYLTFFNTDDGQVSLFITDYEQPLIYRF